MYFFDLTISILDAFFFTASVGLPSCAATSAVELLEKIFLSNLMSSFVQVPFVSFFFAIFFPLTLDLTAFNMSRLSHS